MKGDEFDGPGEGPIPPYERSWRHPAEVAHDARTEFVRHASAPPLSRRTSIIVAFSSVLASALLLAVAIPKGIDRATESSEDSVENSMISTPVKNVALANPVLTVDDRAVSALPVGGLLMVTSADAVKNASSLTVTSDGVSRDAFVIGVDDATSTAVVEIIVDEVDNFDIGNVLPDLPPVALPEADMQVVHSGSGEKFPCHPSLELTNKSTIDRAPVITDGALEGAGTVLDAFGNPLGVAVRSRVATWMVSRQVIEDAMSRVLQLRG